MKKRYARVGTPASEPRTIELRRKGRGKKELALALAVSLWMAGGGVASAGQTTTIAADHNGNVYGNHNGTDWATYSGGPNDNTVNMTGGEVKNEGTYVKVLGAYVTTEKASGN
ncbi:MAG: hypothetical protein IJU05_03175, partial [Schwartzia sp.]|nr:hypothetical protein [Schwartzia sp. (in: firmicutes)]